ncbi:MBL fold metallo-hydrolase [Lentzea sp. JNUCC 0626]|uniref:MBL fold metallo-hydrolase n=1 Tax=Lentzea sp. JNUCC 0626 TaxID=3367513 RepID=UPI003747B724
MSQHVPVRAFGGPTTQFSYGGLNFVTDPTFDAPGEYPVPNGQLVKTESPRGTVADLGRIDVVLLSHPHPDHLDHAGRALLAEVPQVITTVSAADLGDHVTGLADFESIELKRPDGGTVVVTAAPAVHGPGTREHVESVLGEVIGFVLTADDLPSVYVSGDNASLDEVRKIADRYAPVGTAILFAGAPRAPLFDGQCIVLDSKQAAEAARLLDARQIVPVHYDGWAHFTEGRADLEAAFAVEGLADRLDWGRDD